MIADDSANWYNYAGKGLGNTKYSCKCPALWPSIPLLALQPSEAFIHVQQGDMPKNVLCRIVFNNKKLKMTQICISKKMGTNELWYIDNGAMLCDS